MPNKPLSSPQIYHQDCAAMVSLQDQSIDALITDPPYGLSYQNNEWDKAMPEISVWQNCISKLKPGAYGAVFSSVRLMHRMMVRLEDSGFIIRDVLFWSYLNGMPKSRDIALDIDKELGINSKKSKPYHYVQGYKKGGADNYYTANEKWKMEPASELGMQYKGAGLGLKPAYEPIILIQKPIQKGKNVAENIIEYGTGALNIEETRIPYEKNETKVGHNPHPKGRVPANIIRTEAHNDSYDKYFLIPKVRQKAESYNHHPTLKPVNLMEHLVALLSWQGQTILDPFMGSGSTGVAAQSLHRNFIGYEINAEYYSIAEKRMGMV